ncbi:PDDEXK nuclease domain-containing protein [Subtercola boreus]|uniref:PDDEXK nuclease domain-containing protein n=1 Tax=Subtercola boreus TaxID=120213 RepID=UPI001FEC460E|nr:PDDEXK nuclease domain-containing protein [Subtercola boreus]
MTHGWSRNVLEHHIKTKAHIRFEAATTNFASVLDPADSELAQQITKDPYVLDFLAIGSGLREREIEKALVERIIDTLRELGDGFAFVGKQVHLEVAGDDFFVDLLFFHVEQLRYVVVELKTGTFKPEYLGQLGFYSLGSQRTSIGVASYDMLPPAVRASLPSEAALAEALKAD